MPLAAMPVAVITKVCQVALRKMLGCVCGFGGVALIVVATVISFWHSAPPFPSGNLGPGVRLTPRDDRTTLDTPALEKVAIEAARLAPLVRTEPPAPRSCDAARGVRGVRFASQGVVLLCL